MNTIITLATPVLMGGKSSLRTVCYNGSLKFNTSKRLITDNNA